MLGSESLSTYLPPRAQAGSCLTCCLRDSVIKKLPVHHIDKQTSKQTAQLWLHNDPVCIFVANMYKKEALFQAIKDSILYLKKCTNASEIESTAVIREFVLLR